MVTRMGEAQVTVVVLLCLISGYQIVNVLLNRKSAAAHGQQSWDDKTQRESDRADSASGAGTPFNSIENHYRQLLGIHDSAGEHEMRSAFRAQLAKYHPGKVTHLGNEFYDLASRRTREIIEAYNFLKRKYDFK
jgi:DnaJ-domain-containing protein 1